MSTEELADVVTNELVFTNTMLVITAVAFVIAVIYLYIKVRDQEDKINDLNRQIKYHRNRYRNSRY